MRLSSIVCSCAENVIVKKRIIHGGVRKPHACSRYNVQEALHPYRSTTDKAYYHIKIGVDNSRWDSLTAAGYDVFGKDSSWTGVYRSAVQKRSDAWTVETAIPWSAIKMAVPKSGEKIKGNLERRTHRWGDSIAEFSSWSEQRNTRCPEAENFGTWIFE
jgi:hypothetical protein